MSNRIENARETRRFGAVIHRRLPSGLIDVPEMSVTSQVPFDATTSIARRGLLLVHLNAVHWAFGGESTGAGVAVTPADQQAFVEPFDLIETGAVELHRAVTAATGWAEPGEAGSVRPVRGATNQSTRAAATARVDRLLSIQASLGFPLQSLARVLRISRPNLYKWLDRSRAIKLQSERRRRLATIESVAALWRRRTNMPLGLVMDHPVSTGKTVLELLTNEDLDEEALASAFDELAETLRGRPKTRSERRAEAGFERRKSHRALPRGE